MFEGTRDCAFSRQHEETSIVGDSFENRASGSEVRDLPTVWIDSVPSLPGFMDFTSMSFPCSHPSIFVRVASIHMCS